MPKHNLPILSLDRALQLNSAALAVLSALFLQLGHESAGIPLLLAIAAALALWFTDILGKFQLNRLIGNLITITAVIWSLRHFFAMASTGQLLAIANMLAYLQIVLLFQRKNARVYWQLLVLSLLQAVVAAALDMGPQFGLLLSGYLLAVLSSLLLLCIYRDSHPEQAWRPIKIGRTRPARAKPEEAWQLLLAPPVLALPPPAHQTAAWGLALNLRGLAWQVCALACVTFLFTAVFFYATPRWSDSSWLGPRSNVSGAAGMSAEVRLVEAGQIPLSHRVVMRVTLTRGIDQQPVPLTSDPYFQGAALTTYIADEQGSRWTNTQPPWRLTRIVSPTNLVRQDIVLETQGAPQLLAMWPLQRVADPPQALLERSFYGLALKNPETTLLARQLRYAYATPAIRNGRQLAAVPHQKRDRAATRSVKPDPRTDAELFEAELAELRAFDVERFPRLAETAARIIQDQNLDSAGPLDKALALERHFRLPGAYEYSLNLNVARNQELDPVEDFVANHRKGHCQYFASALALMLRSQGIPSRVVIGYKGGQFNDLGRYFVVQQRHAHAWVEAWMPSGEVPVDELAGPDSPSGAWYRLDPTPFAPLLAESADESGPLQRLAQAFDYVDLLWRDYVLSLNKSRQEDALFDPLTAQASALPAWSEGRNVQRWMRHMSRRLGFSPNFSPEAGPRRVFESTLAVMVAGGLVILIVTVQAWLFTRRQFRRWLQTNGRRHQAASSAPAFYRHFEKLLSRAGLRRQGGQTPQELAAAAGSQLAAGKTYQAAGIPAEIVAAYYRVRFGGARLDKVETEAIEQALVVLNTSLRHKHSN